MEKVTNQIVISSHKKAEYLGLTSERFKYPDIGESAKEECDKAKKKDRSEIKSLSEWQRYNYWCTSWCKDTIEKPSLCEIPISYENYDDLTIDQFRQEYEIPNKPLIIKNATQSWPALKNWTFEVTMI
jgi:hypothetical protein